MTERALPLLSAPRHRTWASACLPLLVAFWSLAGCQVDEIDEAAAPPNAEAPASPADEPDWDTVQVADEYVDEVGALASHPDVQAALDYLEAIEERSLGELITLTEIPAPPFMEEERARAYAEMLREAGADSVWTDEEGNVLALRRGTSGQRTVALDGHLDTVFPPETDVTVEIRGDTLFAPGIGDDTRGLIVVRNVLEALVAHDIRTPADLLFIGTVGEEGLGDLSGVKHLFSQAGPGIDSWISVDGGGDASIIHRGVGSHRYRITFEGPGGHSWSDFGMVNPAHALAQAVTHFLPAADQHTATGPRTSYSVGRIGGGTSVNSVPFEAWLELDLRSVDPVSLQAIDDLFQEAVQAGLEGQNALRRHGEPLTVDVDMVGNRPAGVVDPATPLVQRAMAATRFLDREPSLTGASTNANTPIAEGVPAITIGRGGHGGNAHSLDEWWLPVDPHVAAQRALLVLLAEAGGVD